MRVVIVRAVEMHGVVEVAVDVDVDVAAAYSKSVSWQDFM